MNKVEFLSPDVDSGRRPVASHELRAPPKAAKLLLCVWGYSYVRQFLECGLPTLLAPGTMIRKSWFCCPAATILCSPGTHAKARARRRLGGYPRLKTPASARAKAQR